MELGVLSMLFAALGAALLAITNTLREAIYSKAMDAAIFSALISLGLAVILGAFDAGSAAGMAGMIIGALGFAVSGGSLIMFNMNRTVPRRPNTTLREPANDQERTGVPNGLASDAPRDGDGDFALPLGPVRRDPPIGCAIQHLYGFEFLVVDLNGGTWRTSYSVRIFAYVRNQGQRVDLYIDGVGSVSWGITSSRKTVRIRDGELFGLNRCLDRCTKILFDAQGTPSVSDSPLTASFKIEQQLVGTDTLYLYLTAAASMEGRVSISSAIPGTPTIGISEPSSQITYMLGANAFKCLTVGDGVAGNAPG